MAEASVEPRESIVFIVAHPDDVAFAAGGTAWLLSRRYDLHVLCVCRGGRGWDKEARKKFKTPPPQSPQIAVTRSAEEQAACDLLGARLTFLDQLDGEILPERHTCRRVAEILSEIQPKAVLTHGPYEKPDHNAVFTIAWQALHIANRFWTTDLCMFHHWPDTVHMQSPSIYVNIDSVIDRKRELVRCHASHLHHDGAVEEILERNRMLGHMVHAEYAEAFTSSVPLVNRRWNRKAECGQFLLDLE